ncbi:MAG: hypothetical protein WA231_01505 [Methylocella sp.]
MAVSGNIGPEDALIGCQHNLGRLQTCHHDDLVDVGTPNGLTVPIDERDRRPVEKGGSGRP